MRYQLAIPKVRYSERLFLTVTLVFMQFGLGIDNVGIALQIVNAATNLRLLNLG